MPVVFDTSQTNARFSKRSACKLRGKAARMATRGSCVLLISLLYGRAEAAIDRTWIPQNVTYRPSTAGAKATSRDGKSELQVGCNELLGSEVYATLYGYPGRALRRVDDASENVVFKVLGGSKPESFPTRMHYVELEKAWALTDPLPFDFLDAFSAGGALTIRNGAGGGGRNI